MSGEHQLRAIGYCRVSTDKQGERGYGLDAQRTAIREAAESRGWNLVDMPFDIKSGKSTQGRKELERTLKALDQGEADVLVVAKLDRLSRSTLDFANIMARAERTGWKVVIVDMGVDTTSPNGELIVNVLMSLARWERRMIGQRTSEALQEIKASGRRLGRPVTVSPLAEETIRVLRADGRSYYSIAKTLNENKVPTAQGGEKWWPSSVRDIYERVLNTA